MQSIGSPADLVFVIGCRRCGSYEITGQLQTLLMKNPLTYRALANASGWVRQNQGALLAEADEAFIRRLRTPPVGQRGEYLLRHLATVYPRAGHAFRIDLNDPAYVAITWSEAVGDLYFIAWDYLGREQGFLAPDVNDTFGNSTKITSKGWAFLESLDLNPGSPHGFVAMAFRQELVPVYERAIRPAIEEAGYEALRIDRKRHENLIEDEIVAAIRRSRFVVADFTFQSNGVFYEAGYARGLGLRVIRTCRDTDTKQVHFDQSHYHIQSWRAEALEEFAQELRFRIEAAVGRGPKPPG